MALTRSMLRELGITDKDTIDSIMEVNGEMINEMKELKKLTEIKPDTTELDLLKADYDKLKTDYDTLTTENKNYQSEITTAKQDKILHNLFKDSGANEKLIPLLLKNIDREKLEFDGDKLKDTKIIETMKTEYSDIFGKVESTGDTPNTPPAETPDVDLFIAGFDGV